MTTKTFVQAKLGRALRKHHPFSAEFVDSCRIVTCPHCHDDIGTYFRILLARQSGLGPRRGANSTYAIRYGSPFSPQPAATMRAYPTKRAALQDALCVHAQGGCGVEIGNLPSRRGYRQLSRAEALEVRALYDAADRPLREIAAQYGVSVTAVSNIGRRKVHVE